MKTFWKIVFVLLLALGTPVVSVIAGGGGGGCTCTLSVGDKSTYSLSVTNGVSGIAWPHAQVEAILDVSKDYFRCCLADMEREYTRNNVTILYEGGCVYRVVMGGSPLVILVENI